MSDASSSVTLGWQRSSQVRTSAEDVYLRLKAMIHGGSLSPGDRLPPERELSDLLSVSRSTLREGLSVLRSEGYAEVRRGVGGGTFVADLQRAYARWLSTMAADDALLREIIDLRTAVECQIAWLAADRRDDTLLVRMRSCLDVDGAVLTTPEFREIDSQFHGLLAEAAASDRLTSLMLSARGELFTPASALLTSNQTIVRSHGEHLDILCAVERGDSQAASKVMRVHLQSTFDDVTSAVTHGAGSQPD